MRLKHVMLLVSLSLVSIWLHQNVAYADDKIETSTNKTKNGGGASASLEKSEKSFPPPPKPASGKSSKETTPEVKWNTYCGSYVNGEYRSGRSVSLTQNGNQIAVVCNAGGYDGASRGNTNLANLPEYFYSLPAGSAPVVDVTVLRDRAAARIDIADPVVVSNPSFNEPGRFGVVGIPTWFWLNDPWVPVTESESQGSVSVTVIASPTSVSWDPGDRSVPVVCFDAGTPWVKGTPEEASVCKHTYRSSSADQPDMVYNLSAEVNWSFTWSVNGVDQGEFTTVQASTGFTYQVGEIQAIEVR